jgi:hypothetical protein
MNVFRCKQYNMNPPFRQDFIVTWYFLLLIKSSENACQDDHMANYNQL